ncbi:prolyl-tRNA synthetase [Tetragenococcus muriaticus 3MR10-3]|uniref:Prolyl-tRNA synthetase n=1 Tax=Tetragenococcus muriaticus 3MR10-3 TaxID=1302648 RepID=A0A091C7F6_9ENTE|nr:prolyl-tRNA synthetase [Tetragenococcus muriaticus 3MR10-3]
MSEQTNAFTEWYLQTVQQSELMAYSSVRGSVIFRPDGYELWEHIQEEFNKFLKNKEFVMPIFLC